MSKTAYKLLTRLPDPLVSRLQDLANRSRRLRPILRRLSAGVRTGEHPIAGGPAAGMLIDVSGGRPSYILGTAEEEVVDALLPQMTNGGVFYDLGANIGYFTLIAARAVGNAGHVRAYEPLPDNAVALRRNVSLNGLLHVEVIEAAVSDADGEASFAANPSDQKGRLGEGALTVRTVSIDGEVQRGARPPTVVKMDIEGAEMDAIRGMRETLRKYRPFVLCEVHGGRVWLNEHPVARTLEESGYRVRWLEGEHVDGALFWTPHIVGEHPDSPPAGVAGTWG